MYNHAKRVLSVLLFLSLMFFVFSVHSESSSWDCPECGKKSNTNNFCEDCAHPAPWIYFGLGFPMENFEAKMQSLIDQAEKWTKDTAPQTVDSFPLLAHAVFQLHENMDENTVSLESNKSQYLIYSTIHDLVTEWLGQSYDNHQIKMEYWDNGQWNVTPLLNTDNHHFTVELPAGHEDDEIRVEWEYEWKDLGADLWGGFSVTYYFQQGKIKEDLFMNLYVRNNMGFCMEWTPSFPVNQIKATNATWITVDSFALNKSWTFQYDLKTKKLVDIY